MHQKHWYSEAMNRHASEEPAPQAQAGGDVPPTAVQRVTPEERHAALTAMLERDRESAWHIAHYERAQRDEYTSKLRFGLAALNAASMVTVLNLQTALAGVEPGVILLSAAAFLAGTVLAGYSLVAHQTHLIDLVGSTSSRAISLDRAVSLTAFPIGSDEHDALGEAMRQAHHHQADTYKFSMPALHTQWLSASTWVSATGVLAVAKAASLFPNWHLVREWPF